jgi:hypothetical protein
LFSSFWEYIGVEAAGVEFIDENGGGAGVRFRKPGDKGLKKAK